MCGIAGIFGKHANESNLMCMLEKQKHRGPDNTGTWLSDNVVLGHNRLSIIDLSENANQPFLDNSGRFILLFNGEIYNYKELYQELKREYNFLTNSDTEVLLAAYLKWGKDCMHKLNGMFSFGIFDSLTEKFFAARDRFGVKPFFYLKTNDTFYFSSEIKTIRAVVKDLDFREKAWADYFCFGSYGLPHETFWNGIKQLPGGHFLNYYKNEVSVEKWYNFENEIKKYNGSNLSFDEVKTKYVKLLKHSIELRFRADVNLGFNISGGLDSSTLLTFVNLYQRKDRVNAFTFYTGNKNYDELPWVEKMISLTNNPLNKVLLTSHDLIKKINTMAQIQDEPYGGVPTIAYGEIFKNAREKGIKVLLDGQGMDEQWAGYDYYLKSSNSVIQGVSKNPFKTNVFNESFMNLAKKPEYPKPFDDHLLNLQYRDIFYTKIPRALRFNDRVSMASSTELREPFLDYRLVEFAFSLPREYKIYNGQQKYLLRHIVSEFLSDDISYAPKRPLQTPQREWIQMDIRNYVEEQIELLLTSKFKKWFNNDEIKKEWDNYKNGNIDSSFHVWQWLSLSNLLNTV